MILAADIGGTKTSMALFDEAQPSVDGRDAPRRVREETYASAEHSGLESILAEFLGEDAPALRAASFGIAGPVLGDRCETPNLPWVVEGTALGERFGIPRVALINDLVATAHGMAALLPDELETLAEGSSPAETATRALVAPGTGLGMASLVWSDRWRPLPSEGAHAEFAPRDDVEAGLLRFLLERFPDPVSLDRVVTGPGLAAIYEWVASDAGESNPQVAAAIAKGDKNAPRLVSEQALSGECELCVQALDRFCSFLGAAAGNLVLSVLATGGLYLGGGIPPKILPALRRAPFLEGFRAKGRLRGLMEAVPVHVITNPEAALLGAARHATTLAEETS